MDASATPVSVPTSSDLENWFTYHAPTPDQVDKYSSIRIAAKSFAKIVMDNCPPGADRTTAIRKIREAVMTANASIACA